MAKKLIIRLGGRLAGKGKSLSQKIKKIRIYLVNYTMLTGEYEFSGQTILTCKPGDRIKAHVHEYFLDFWGDKPDYDKKYDSYMYHSGCAGVKKIYWKQITPEDREVLSRLSIC